MSFPRSRALFEGAPPPAAALSQAEDDADYRKFYKGKHAFECLAWDNCGGIYYIEDAPVGYEDYDNNKGVPNGILDDRAFTRGYFKAPFQFAMDHKGQIRANGLSPDITIRRLSESL
jgi:hypothetical protein